MPWSPEKLEELRKRNAAIVSAYVGGESTASLALVFGLSKTAINQIVKDSGLIPKAKICSSCGERKLHEEFRNGRASRTKNGLSDVCNECDARMTTNGVSKCRRCGNQVPTSSIINENGVRGNCESCRRETRAHREFLRLMDLAGTARCGQCKTIKPLEEMMKHHCKRPSICKVCSALLSRCWRVLNPEGFKQNISKCHDRKRKRTQAAKQFHAMRAVNKIILNHKNNEIDKTSED